jgi:serine/threonine protein kinase
MSFRPVVDSIIQIDRHRYIFTEHPAAQGMPYGQSGKRAIVYQVKDAKSKLFALKIFNRVFRTEHIENSTGSLKMLSHLPGLTVCNRRVITSCEFPKLLLNIPDLQYSVLMPWVDSLTWQEFLISKRRFTPLQSLTLAVKFLNVLTKMEQNEVAHCDLSGPNVLITDLDSDALSDVQLVDVEEMFGPGLTRPDRLPAGSAGYAHQTSRQGIWTLDGDRFAGAILLAEMLCWFDSHVRESSYGEQYFAPEDLHQPVERYEVLRDTLKTFENSQLLKLLDAAWESQKLGDCPPFVEWQKALAVQNVMENHRTRGLPTFKPDYTPLVLDAPKVLEQKKKSAKKSKKTSPVLLKRPQPIRAKKSRNEKSEGISPGAAISGIILLLFFIFSLVTLEPSLMVFSSALLFVAAIAYRVLYL